MKVVVLAGGLGTRLSEETEARPKPMVEIGGRPILWHILKHYAHFGFQEFYVALGYKGESIKRFFLDYHALGSNMSVSLRDGRVEVHDAGEREDWRVHLIETGLETNTGGRLKRLEPFLSDGTFMLTYGDGVSDVDLGALLKFHRAHGRLATVTAVRPPSRFGGLIFEGDRVSDFEEKPQIGEGWINGGFLVLEPGFFQYLAGDGASLEANGLEAAARDGQLMAFRHERFWQCMDTLRELRILQTMWTEQRAPWKLWK
jgi:glucose-1-phosphate cytidylyltransferase